jgi:hypothetical protein
VRAIFHWTPCCAKPLRRAVSPQPLWRKWIARDTSGSCSEDCKRGSIVPTRTRNLKRVKRLAAPGREARKWRPQLVQRLFPPTIGYLMGFMQLPQSLARGVLNGLAQCRHGGPCSDSRWWNTALGFVSRSPVIRSYAASIGVNIVCKLPPALPTGSSVIT